MTSCSVDGCESSVATRGYCGMHYARVRRNGHPGGSAKLREVVLYDSDVCSVDGCDRPRDSRGWCRIHYGRWQRKGHTAPRSATAVGTQCWVEDCDGLITPKSARGLCSPHYQRLLLTGCPTGSTRPTNVDRFFAKVEQVGECWRWTATCDGSGYGLFHVDKEKHIRRAHIWSYEYFIAEVPPGLQLDHLCHTKICPGGVACHHRKCVNPWHLEPVTPLINTQRGHGSKRERCPMGHDYTQDNTYINPAGAKVCRRCSVRHRTSYELRKKTSK